MDTNPNHTVTNMTDKKRTKADANSDQVKQDAQNTFEKASGHKPPAGTPPKTGGDASKPAAPKK